MKKLIILLAILLTVPISTARSSVEHGGGLRWLAVSSSAPDLLTNWTIAFWIYPTADPATWVPGFYLRSATGARQVYIHVTNAGVLGVDVPYVKGDIVVGTTVISTLNVWYHVAVTRSGNDWTIWLNGVIDGGPTTDNTAQQSGGTFYLCGIQSCCIFIGRLAELAGWPAVLTTGEIKALAHGTPPNRIRVGLLKSGGFYWPLHTRNATPPHIWADLGGGSWNATANAADDTIAGHAPMSPPGGAD